MATEEKLTQVFDNLVEFYIKKLKDNDLSASEQKNLVQLLKDNNITIDPKQKDPLEAIANGDFTDINWEEFEEM